MKEKHMKEKKKKPVAQRQYKVIGTLALPSLILLNVCLKVAGQRTVVLCFDKGGTKGKTRIFPKVAEFFP